jgi:hypothetical protein
MVQTTHSRSTYYHNVLTNVLKTYDMNFTTSKEIENFNEEDFLL